MAPHKPLLEDEDRQADLQVLLRISDAAAVADLMCHMERERVSSTALTHCLTRSNLQSARRSHIAI